MAVTVLPLPTFLSAKLIAVVATERLDVSAENTPLAATEPVSVVVASYTLLEAVSVNEEIVYGLIFKVPLLATTL